MSIEAPRLLCVTGTTGTGKNDIGILLAERLNGEIISLDSMKVYRGMDIGTAKPSPADLAQVPHHLVDILDPTERIDLARFIERARAHALDIVDRGRVPIVVGGTQMYLNGLLYGVHQGPPRNEEFRARLRAEADEIGVPALHERLRGVDPKSADRIEPQDYRRIERALEVAEFGDRPLGEESRDWFREPRHPFLLRLLTWPREELRRRIDRRIDRMLEAGWVAEVAAILDAGGFSDEAAMALGYREIRAHLQGEFEAGPMIERIKTKTWQFARRQLTWMRKYEDADRIVLDHDDTHASIADRIVADWRA